MTIMKTSLKNIFSKFGPKVIILAIGILSFGPQVVSAASPAVSLTFDDAWLSQYQNAFPILNAAGKKATLYVNSGTVGTPSYMTWENVVEIINGGWEIGGHGVNHLELPLLSPAEMQAQIANDYATLQAHGLVPINFATPFGAYDSTIVSEIASYYESHRGFHEIGLNQWPYNVYLLYVRQITNATTLAEVEGWIQEAIATNSWLIIVFHEILPTVDPADTYSWTTSDLQALMTSLDTLGIVPQTVAEVLNMKESLLPNSDFFGGISGGWTTDTPLQVLADATGKGAVPTQSSSVRLIGSATQANLYSTSTAISTSTQYGVRIFTDTRELTAGELGFYVDEYDENNVWMSQHFLGTGALGVVIDQSYSYTPTSTSTVRVGLHAYLLAGSTGQAFIDNAIIFETGTGGPLPIPNPIVQITVDLPLPNSDFELGIAQDWTTTNTLQVTADASGHGAEPNATSSIKFTGGALPAHLFSPHARVATSTIYEVTAFSNTLSLTSGELGFFLDEYDTNGNWISGRWLGQATSSATSTHAYSYTPASTLVYAVSLQTYLTASSTGDAYVDNLQITITGVIPPPADLPLLNSDFEAGLSLGWTTDNALQVTADTLGNGTDPNASSSIKFLGETSPAHLFSPHATVGSTTVYSISAFADTNGLLSGEFGFYIDEFDVNGAWVSGRWLGAVALGTEATSTYLYSPTSGTVHAASLQAYLTASSTGEVYIDNFGLDIAGTTTPPVSPISLPLPNSDFEAGITQDWTTTNVLQVTADMLGHGALPNASSSIKFVGDALPAHLFSPHVLVAFSTIYNVSTYVNTTDLPLGEIGFYMDEYDINGNWISGQWLGQATLGTEATSTYLYTPTSGLVRAASLQTYLMANSTGEVYVDNSQITAAGVVEPPPLPISLPIPNTDFEAGISQNWTTNNSLQVTADALGHGSAPNPLSSIKFLGAAPVAHLFSPHALVATTTVYNISVYADAAALSAGELGFYLDEYDLAGNWISGRWLGARALGSATTTTYAYLPTSASVSSASLQTYLLAGSVGEAYVDNFKLEVSGI